MTDRKQWRQRLRAVTGPRIGSAGIGLVEVLLPVVAGIVADELRAAADEAAPWEAVGAVELRARADRLDPR